MYKCVYMCVLVYMYVYIYIYIYIHITSACAPLRRASQSPRLASESSLLQIPQGSPLLNIIDIIYYNNVILYDISYYNML